MAALKVALMAAELKVASRAAERGNKIGRREWWKNPEKRNCPARGTALWAAASAAGVVAAQGASVAGVAAAQGASASLSLVVVAFFAWPPHTKERASTPVLCR